MEVYLYFCEDHYEEFQNIMRKQGHPVATGGKLSPVLDEEYGIPCSAKNNDHTNCKHSVTHYVSFFTEDLTKER